jgi:hypothetical protein
LAAALQSAPSILLSDIIDWINIAPSAAVAQGENAGARR